MKNEIIIGNDEKGNLLLSNEDGLFESHDYGKTWEQWIPEIMDFETVVHSSWRTLCGYSKCNNCGQRSKVPTNYCPNCGAKMDKE